MIEKKPIKETKNKRCNIRLSEEDLWVLEKLSERLGVSKSEVVRRGLELMTWKASEEQDLYVQTLVKNVAKNRPCPLLFLTQQNIGEKKWSNGQKKWANGHF